MLQALRTQTVQVQTVTEAQRRLENKVQQHLHEATIRQDAFFRVWEKRFADLLITFEKNAELAASARTSCEQSVRSFATQLSGFIAEFRSVATQVDRLSADQARLQEVFSEAGKQYDAMADQYRGLASEVAALNELADD